MKNKTLGIYPSERKSLMFSEFADTIVIDNFVDGFFNMITENRILFFLGYLCVCFCINSVKYYRTGEKKYKSPLIENIGVGLRIIYAVLFILIFGLDSSSSGFFGAILLFIYNTASFFFAFTSKDFVPGLADFGDIVFVSYFFGGKPKITLGDTFWLTICTCLNAYKVYHRLEYNKFGSLNHYIVDILVDMINYITMFISVLVTLYGYFIGKSKSYRFLVGLLYGLYTDRYIQMNLKEID